MRQGILATVLILCGLLPQAASAVPMDYDFKLTPETPTDIIGVDEVRAQRVANPTALLLVASTLLLMWAATRRRSSPRSVSIE